MVGFAAAGLVLLTFTTKEMRQLRLIALISNVAFITYGVLGWLPPVIVLHVVLLPVNLLRLLQLQRGTAPGAEPPVRVHAIQQTADGRWTVYLALDHGSATAPDEIAVQFADGKSSRSAAKIPAA